MKIRGSLPHAWAATVFAFIPPLIALYTHDVRWVGSGWIVALALVWLWPMDSEGLKL